MQNLKHILIACHNCWDILSPLARWLLSIQRILDFNLIKIEKGKFDIWIDQQLRV